MDENEIKDTVTQGYRNVLKREPDPGGLSNYINEIKNGLSIERFYHILRTSEEYRQRFGGQSHLVPFYVPPSQNTSDQQSTIIPFNVPIPSQNVPSVITYCMIGGNKLHEIKDYIPIVISYVDKFVYVDSGSTDGTIEFLKDLSSKNNNKIDIIVREWQDKFSYFRNFYLEHLRNQNYNGWVLTSDTDEHFPQETLSQLRDIIGDTHNGIQFRAYDITINDNDGTKIVSQSLSNYWKGLMFKFHQNLRYEGEPHESLVGEPINWKQTDLIYKHVRSQLKVYYRATENFFISNSNRYSSKWGEFRILCSKNDMIKFAQFIERCKNGDLPKDVEDWIYDHRNDNSDSGDSEVREMAKLYYEILHPEKNRDKS